MIFHNICKIVKGVKYNARMQECKNARMQECKNARMQECKNATNLHHTRVGNSVRSAAVLEWVFCCVCQAES